jgi:hypothetical protein
VSDDAQCVVEALAIIQVEWVWFNPENDPCTYMTPSDVTITTTATPTGLSYSYSVMDCTGSDGIDTSEVVLTCQNQTLMSGSVTVTDSQNNQATVSFAFDACINGRVCADGEPCCTEGTTRCNEGADQVEQCEADGSWEVAGTCGPGQRCYLNGPIAECRAEDCTEPDFQCVESDGWPGTDVEYCWNGTWVLSQSCQEGKPAGWVCVINDAHDPPLYYCGAP